MEQGLERRFCIDFDGDIFEAFEIKPNAASRVAAERGLEDLLAKCKDAGLTHFAGLTPDAIDFVHDWLNKGRPANAYVEDLWEGPSSGSRSIGFRTPE